MLLLAMDTSTPAVTAALHDDERVLAEATTISAPGRRHGELLAPMIAEVLAEGGADPRELTDVAVGVGPGPFTGLRVGLVTARVMASTLGVAVHGVCSLDVLAAELADRTEPVDADFLVVSDARRREVYWARYAGPYARLTEPAVDTPAAVNAANPNVSAVGAGAALYPDWFADVGGPELPSAGTLARLAVHRIDEGVPMLPPEPMYLRRPDVAEPAPRKRVSAP